MPIFSILFSIVLSVEILSRSIRQEKKKGIQIRTEEPKQSLFADDRVLYIYIYVYIYIHIYIHTHTHIYNTLKTPTKNDSYE